MTSYLPDTVTDIFLIFLSITGKYINSCIIVLCLKIKMACDKYYSLTLFLTVCNEYVYIFICVDIQYSFLLKFFYGFIWTKLIVITGMQNLKGVRKCSRKWHFYHLICTSESKEMMEGGYMKSLVIDLGGGRKQNREISGTG